MTLRNKSVSVREYNRAWRAANPDKCAAYTKKYREKNPGKHRIKQKMWVRNNREHVLAYHRRWRKENKSIVLAASKKWRTNNPIKMKEAATNWRKNNREHINKHYRLRCATDHAFRLGRNLRGRLSSAIREQKTKKSSNTISLTGCSLPFLIGYIEARFKLGMTWANYGSVWEVDHRIPCASYDLSDPSHQRSCFHYSNLQPLYVHENRRKRANIPDTSVGINLNAKSQ